MVRVVLRNGKVLEYNQGQAIAIEQESFSIRHGGAKGTEWLIARIPVDVVERVEFDKPCRIRRAKRMPKRADY